MKITEYTTTILGLAVEDCFNLIHKDITIIDCLYLIKADKSKSDEFKQIFNIDIDECILHADEKFQNKIYNLSI
jgi:hypothetical protein